MKPSRLTAIVGSVAIFILAGLLMSSIQFNPNNPYLSEYDGYYHVKMAEVIREKGVIKTFPWMQYTTLRDEYVNHHFLFHVLLIPFITVLGPITGAKVAIVLIVAAAFSVLYLFYREIEVPTPFAASVLSLFLLAGDFYFRMNFVRNMGLSLLLLLLGMLATVRNKPLWVGIITYLYGLAYGGSFFLPMFVGIFIVARFLMGEKVPWKILLATALGFIAGIVINPYFPSNVSFLFLQVFKTGLGAQGYTGGEWQPYDTWYWVTTNAVPLTLWFGSVTLVLLHRGKQTAASVATFLLSVAFLILVWKSKRFVEYSPLILIASAFALSAPFLAEKLAQWRERTFWKVPTNIFYAAALLVLIPFALSYGGRQIAQARLDTQTLFSMSALQRVHGYLMENSREGEIVFTDDWDVFPKYFFANTKNHYIVGLDPEFMNQYRGEPYPGIPGKLYREFAEISSGNDATRLDLIKRDFRANWIIVGTDHNQFYRNLENRPDLFEEVLFTQNDPSIDKYPSAQGDGYHLFKVR